MMHCIKKAKASLAPPNVRPNVMYFNDSDDTYQELAKMSFALATLEK